LQLALPLARNGQVAGRPAAQFSAGPPLHLWLHPFELHSIIVIMKTSRAKTTLIFLYNFVIFFNMLLLWRTSPARLRYPRTTTNATNGAATAKTQQAEPQCQSIL